jgi:nitrite reductase/ring-hydroxylating ferredoxin subunit
MSKSVLIGKVNDFVDESARVVNAEGTAMVVARVGDEFCAVLNKCPHLGLPLTAGKVKDGTITCPFHSSVFDMCSGENKDWVRGVGGIKMPEWSRRLLAMGKTPGPVKTFQVRVEGEDVFVEI